MKSFSWFLLKITVVYSRNSNVTSCRSGVRLHVENRNSPRWRRNHLSLLNSPKALPPSGRALCLQFKSWSIGMFVLVLTDLLVQLQPQEISPPPTANLDRSNDKVYENVTGLVKAVIEMSNRIQPAAPEEYVPMVKVTAEWLMLHWKVRLGPTPFCRCRRWVWLCGRCWQRWMRPFQCCQPARTEKWAHTHMHTHAHRKQACDMIGSTIKRLRSLTSDQTLWIPPGGNGSEAAELRSGRVDSQDEAGSAVRHDKVQTKLGVTFGFELWTSNLCVSNSLQKDYKKQMLMAAHALAVDAKNLLDVIDQARLKAINQTRPL